MRNLWGMKMLDKYIARRNEQERQMRREKAEAVQTAEAKAETVTAILTLADDALASQFVSDYPVLTYGGSLIPAGTRINWEGKLLRAKVDLWDREENDPVNAPGLWDEISYHGGYRVIPEVITAELAFAPDEVGYWPGDGKYYRNVSGVAMTHTPDAYPRGWEEVMP